jgi:hypothetical protein
MTNDELAYACEMAWKHRLTSEGQVWRGIADTECRMRAMRRRRARDCEEPGEATKKEQAA